MKDVARWAVIVPLALIPFLALIVTDSFFFPFITGKGFFFRILVEIACAGWLLLALLDTKYRPQFSWTLVFYGALVLWMVVANAFAVSPEKAFWGNFERMEGWITILHAFILFVILGSFLTAETMWRKAWLTFLVSSAIVSLYSLLQLACAGSLCGAPGHFFQIHQGGARVDGTLGNAIYLAQYLIFATGIALWQAIESKDWLRPALFSLAAVHVVVLFFTATRGSILALFIAAVLGALWYAYDAGGQGKRIALGLFIALLLLGGALFTVRHSAWVQTEPTLARLVSVFSASEWQTRFTIWGIAGEGFLERPVTGWGQEGFNYVFNEHYKPSLYGQEQWFDRAHNLYLDWLIAGGLPALVFLLAMLGAAVVALYRKTSRTTRVLLIGVVGAYAIQSLSAFDNLFTYIPLAAVLAYAHTVSMRPVRQIEELDISTETATNVGAPLVVVGLVLVLWFVNVPGMATAHDLILGMQPSKDQLHNLEYFKDAANHHSFASQEVSEQTVSYAVNLAGNTAIPEETRALFIAQAIEQIEDQLTRRPLDARLYSQASLAYRVAGDYSTALTRTEKAIKLSPQKQPLLIDAGTIAWQMGDVSLARSYYEQAYELTPGADSLVIYAALGHIISNDTKGAQALLLDQFATTTIDNDLLVYAYYDTKQYEEIIPILVARTQKDGMSPESGWRLASMYALLNRFTDARRVIDATIKAHPEVRRESEALYKQITTLL